MEFIDSRFIRHKIYYILARFDRDNYLLKDQFPSNRLSEGAITLKVGLRKIECDAAIYSILPHQLGF